METYAYTQSGAYFMVFLILFVPALITGLISYISSNFIENQVLDINADLPPEAVKPPGRARESLGLTMKIVLLIAVLAGVIFLLQWLIFPNPGGVE